MADQIPSPRVRTFRPLAAVREEPPGPGYEVKALAGSGAAEIYLYDEIGGWWGVDPSAFVRDLMAIDADSIDLHIHSPGGAGYDGMAIYQALRNHKARITVYVDGLAASAAAFIAMAGDRRVIAPHATMMIHEPFGLCIGPAEDMAAAEKMLDKLADNMASLHARRAGGSVAEWRDVMRAETWFSAEEAVAAGLMHAVQEDVEKPDPDSKAQARWDLGAVFAYAGREQAPPPRIPRAAAKPGAVPVPIDPPAAEPEPSTTEEDPVSDLTASVRQRLGLPDDADDATVLAALDDKLTDPDPGPDRDDDPNGDPTPAPEPQPDPTPAPAPPAPQQDPALAQMKAEIARLSAEVAAGKAKEAAATKARVLDDAEAAGKIAPAERPAWEARYDKSPDVTTEILDSMAAGTAVPVAAVGHTGPAEPADDTDWDRLERDLYGPAATSSKGA